MEYHGDKITNMKLYVCDKCDYKTQDKGHSSSHSKSKKCNGCTMKVTIIPVLPVDYVMELLAKSSNDHGILNTIGTNHGNVSSIVDNSVTTNIYIPQNSLKDDMLEFLKTVVFDGIPSTSQIISMPSRVLYNTRNPEMHPGVITERGDKIVEKLPGGGERVMGRKKAIKTYTHEAIDALCQKPPTQHVREYFERERKIGKKEYTLKEAVTANAKNSVEYHHKIPSELKNIVMRLEDRMESEMNNITKENRVLF
ncbi:hypothetical protein NY2A_B522L [Paramecium bursaria Chlorella virus NY2A]|uniref:Uncharacterized protein B522L n=1 Tax=Paramecium bursaria Chlorella virus NY2A TaxID=46021 RepID=A7IX47_PBCVN|nr:hypothetical protein NY2A_B522L [Paramecium bursaria Chlorella virus NY2A]ABT14921.1 hypothetical protein NY2A_B522L [Paramecium bursaria Chlorella virus NY2A]